VTLVRGGFKRLPPAGVIRIQIPVRTADRAGPVGTLPRMPLEGDYEPSPSEWVREQVAEYEASGGERANSLLDTGMPIILVTTRGNKSGKLRKTPLMKVEHGGEYALVASKGGAPTHPVWYHNLTADPTAVMIQDGPEPFDAVVREVEGDERAEWWDRAAAAYPPYAEYQENTDRLIPVLVARPA
jgi:F420H(2)-dependent quinone reductase